MTNRGIIQQTLLVLYFLLSYNEVQGEIKLSETEDQELERQLKLLNKPAIETIKTVYGDIYDCVDFYKQPAFDHPLLKNHNFHPKMKAPLLKQNSRSMFNKPSTIWLNGRGCPFGSVPIKRITKDDLIRHKLMPPPEDVTFHTQFAKTSNYNHSEHKRRFLSAQGYRVATASTLNNWKNKFGGGGMTATLWQPHVEGQQHSACRLKVQKGSDVIQVGWRVDPTLYGDDKTRMFVHFQAGNTNCFNTLCRGFVLSNPQIPIETPFPNVSKRGDINKIYEVPLYINRDLAKGNWWVLIGETYQQLGFWPPNIFTDLKSFATNVKWGGVAYSPPGAPEPPMGSSFFPQGVPEDDGSCENITVINSNAEMVDIKVNTNSDNINFYNVFDISNEESDGHTVYYGGPGEKA